MGRKSNCRLYESSVIVRSGTQFARRINVEVLQLMGWSAGLPTILEIEKANADVRIYPRG